MSTRKLILGSWTKFTASMMRFKSWSCRSLREASCDENAKRSSRGLTPPSRCILICHARGKNVGRPDNVTQRIGFLIQPALVNITRSSRSVFIPASRWVSSTRTLSCFRTSETTSDADLLLVYYFRSEASLLPLVLANSNYIQVKIKLGC